MTSADFLNLMASYARVGDLDGYLKARAAYAIASRIERP